MRSISIVETNPQVPIAQPRGFRTRSRSSAIVGLFDSDFPEDRAVPGHLREVVLYPGPRGTEGPRTLRLCEPASGDQASGGTDAHLIRAINAASNLLKLTFTVHGVECCIEVDGPGHAELIAWNGTWRVIGGYNFILKHKV